MSKYRKYLIIHIICGFMGSAMVLSAQNVDAASSADFEDPYIRWITELPSNDLKNKQTFFEKIFNFIAGSNPIVFNNPVNVFAYELNNYWIVNQGEGMILHFIDGKTVEAHAFKKPENYFPSLVDICNFGSAGFLFTDSRLNKVFTLSLDGKKINVFSDSISLERPTGIAFSEITGEIWVIETGAHRISVFDKSGIKIRTVGSRGNGPLEFNFPTNIWIDSLGRVYVVDAMNFRVQVLSSSGEFITSFGQQGDATGNFARPRGIASDSDGNIYIADALFNSIQVFDISGRLLYYFGSQGKGKNQFWMPSGIYIDKNDYMYVSDSYNGRIQIFQIIKHIQK